MHESINISTTFRLKRRLNIRIKLRVIQKKYLKNILANDSSETVLL